VPPPKLCSARRPPTPPPLPNPPSHSTPPPPRTSRANPRLSSRHEPTHSPPHRSLPPPQAGPLVATAKRGDGRRANASQGRRKASLPSGCRYAMILWMTEGTACPDSHG